MKKAKANDEHPEAEALRGKLAAGFQKLLSSRFVRGEDRAMLTGVAAFFSLTQPENLETVLSLMPQSGRSKR